MPDIYARLESPLMRSRLSSVARGDEDIESAVRIGLIEYALCNPAFAEQSDGYLIKRAAWLARMERRKQACYTRYVESEPDTDDPNACYFDSLADPNAIDPAESAEQSDSARALALALASLPAGQARLARLLLEGLSLTESAARLGITKSCASHTARRMRSALARTLSD